jgi:hypothetical protein
METVMLSFLAAVSCAVVAVVAALSPPPPTATGRGYRRAVMLLAGFALGWFLAELSGAWATTTAVYEVEITLEALPK